MDVWCHEEPPNGSAIDLETAEAEVVFLIRSAGQWPLHQTENYFPLQPQVHRDVAGRVMSHYHLDA